MTTAGLSHPNLQPDPSKDFRSYTFNVQGPKPIQLKICPFVGKTRHLPYTPPNDGNLLANLREMIGTDEMSWFDKAAQCNTILDRDDMVQRLQDGDTIQTRQTEKDLQFLEDTEKP